VKKIGILTFSYSSNPGSILQAYALQQQLSTIVGDRGEIQIVNYQKTRAGKPIIGKTVFTAPLRSWSPKKIINWIKLIVAYPIRMKKCESFFKKYYHNYDKRFYTREDTALINSLFDVFVVGSDQVWNVDSPQVDMTYFLDFVDEGRRKIAYAASLGQQDVPEEQRDAVGKCISDFSNISVRERENVKTVKELTARDAEWVLDPSLLLDKEDYQKLSLAPKMKKKYVFLYLREDSPHLEEFSKKLAEHFGYEVVTVKRHWLCNKTGKERAALGPREWLGYMENAEYVVTNSFHGICFSLIFGKEVYVDLLKGGRAFTNTRILGVMEQFGIADRSIDSITDFASLNKINYDEVNEIRAKRKRHSLSYLANAIEGAL